MPEPPWRAKGRGHAEFRHLAPRTPDVQFLLLDASQRVRYFFGQPDALHGFKFLQRLFIILDMLECRDQAIAFCSAQVPVGEDLNP